MKPDEAIEAIRAVRHRISAEHGHDTRRLIRYYQELEKLYADRMWRGGGSAPPSPKPAAKAPSPK